MELEAGGCETSTSQGFFIVTPSLERSLTKSKEAPSPHEVILAPLYTIILMFCRETEVYCFNFVFEVKYLDSIGYQITLFL